MLNILSENGQKNKFSVRLMGGSVEASELQS